MAFLFSLGLAGAVVVAVGGGGWFWVQMCPSLSTNQNANQTIKPN